MVRIARGVDDRLRLRRAQRLGKVRGGSGHSNLVGGVYIAETMQVGNSKSGAIINVTPLIDVLLVLLITFMILPSRTRGLHSEAPQPPAADQPPVPNPEHVVLFVR